MRARESRTPRQIASTLGDALPSMLPCFVCHVVEQDSDQFALVLEVTVEGSVRPIGSSGDLGDGGRS